MTSYDPEKYQAKREAYRAAAKRYYAKNRDKLIAYQKAYDEAHREDIAKRFKEKGSYGGKLKAKVALE